MNDFDRLFDLLVRNTIGFDNLRPYLSRNAVTFPHYDVIRIDDNNYSVQLALAGYKPEDVDVSVENNVLQIGTVNGTVNPNDNCLISNSVYDWDSSGATKVETKFENGKIQKTLHRGIAKRAFTLSFALPEHFEVDKAEFDNGLLCVDLFRRVPEALKAKRIPITAVGALPAPKTE